MTKSKLTRFSDPEAIDTHIKERISQFNARGGKNVAENKWSESDLDLIEGVVLDYLSQGLSKERIAEQLSDRWEVCMKTGRKYVKQSLQRFTQQYKEENYEEAKKVWLHQVQEVMQKAMSDNTKDSALKALDMVAKYFGMYKDKSEITVQGGENPISFDFK